MSLPLACVQMSIFTQNRVRGQNTSVFTVELFRKRAFSYTAKTIKDQEIHKGKVEPCYEHKK